MEICGICECAEGSIVTFITAPPVMEIKHSIIEITHKNMKINKMNS